MIKPIKWNFRSIKDKANSIHMDKSNQEEKRLKFHWGKSKYILKSRIKK